jgi:hypothetical protein
MAYEDSMVDKRVVKRNIARGVVDAKELEKLHAQLPDRAANIDVRDLGDDYDDEDEDEGGDA